jgi:acetylornithine deacetylase/succinyl-diaminopimelate desuccinylase-like protein
MLEKVLTTAQNDFERHVSRLQRYIKQPSVSAEQRGNEEMAAMLAADINELGGVGRSVPGVDFPIVYGRFDVGAPRTVLIHSMYDTTPADEPTWVVPPFDATRMDFENFGECIVARGAEDTKGPVAAIFNMIDSYRRAGVPLPVNLILLFEASELGSKSLPPFVEAHAEELKGASVAYWPWLTQRADGTGSVWLGCKGLMTFKLRVKAGAWGGPARSDMHGLHEAWIANPAQRLVAAIASLKSADGREILVEGYYGDGDPITAEDEELVQTLARRINVDALKAELGISRFKQDTMADAIRAHCFQSELNISGLQSGYVIENGHKVVLPQVATASLDLRPLDGMNVKQVVGALRRHLDKHGFQEVEIEVLNGYVGGRQPVGNWAVQELIGAYKDTGLDPDIWPRAATAIAVDLFQNRLGMPWIATCPGHAARKHAANEYLQLSSYRNTVPFMCRLMWRLSQAEGGNKK